MNWSLLSVVWLMRFWASSQWFVWSHLLDKNVLSEQWITDGFLDCFGVMRFILTICGGSVSCNRLSSFVFVKFVSLVLPVHLRFFEFVTVFQLCWFWSYLECLWIFTRQEASSEFQKQGWWMTPTDEKNFWDKNWCMKWNTYPDHKKDAIDMVTSAIDEDMVEKNPASLFGNEKWTKWEQWLFGQCGIIAN